MLKPFMDFIVTIVDVMFVEVEEGECGTTAEIGVDLR
jgi:hypothetical protein